MRFIPRILITGLCVAALQATAANAAAHAGAAQAQSMLDKAVAEFDRVGTDKALAEFNQRHGPFNTGELYVFVFDLNGVYEAYGAKPSMVGTDVSRLTDAEGKPIVQEMIQIAQTKGHGHIDYVWLNRADNHIERKSSLVRLVGDHVVGVGYYRD